MNEHGECNGHVHEDMTEKKVASVFLTAMPNEEQKFGTSNI